MELTGLPTSVVDLSVPAPADPNDPATTATAAIFAALMSDLLTPPTIPAVIEQATTPTPSVAALPPDPATGDPIVAETPTTGHGLPFAPVPTDPPAATGGPSSPGTATEKRQVAEADVPRVDAATATWAPPSPGTGANTPRLDVVVPEAAAPADEPTATWAPPSSETGTNPPRLEPGARAATAPADEPTATGGSTSSEAVAEDRRLGSVEPPVPARPARSDARAAAAVEHLAAPAVLVEPQALDLAPLEPASAPAVPAEAAVVVEQLVDHLADLTAQRSDGDHEITVQLDPADLGRVELRVRLQDDRVHVHLGAHERVTADLVRHHVDELRRALEAAGVATGGIDVGQHELGTRHEPPATQRDAAPPTTARTDAPAADPIIRPQIASDRAVDLLL